MDKRKLNGGKREGAGRKPKTEEIKNLQNQLEDLLRQIEEIKQTIPQLQGTVDVNFKEQTLSFDTVDTKIQDLDNTLKMKSMQS